MSDEKRNLLAHLYRRAGFGATSTELGRYSSKEYSDLVEDLLHPENNIIFNDVYYKYNNVQMFVYSLFFYKIYLLYSY